MTTNNRIPQIERSTFFQGQQLGAEDLNELKQGQRHLRWLHNKLHGWGIATGLAVHGHKGDSVVQISPGFGLDCHGREIILTETLRLPVPADPGPSPKRESIYFLTVEYKEDADQLKVERRSGVCLPEGTVRLTEEPHLAWKQAGSVVEGLHLILAQAWIKNCRLSRSLSWTSRHYARSSHECYTAAGQTEIDKTIWMQLSAEGELVGVFTKIDTSSAHFRITPRYTAHIMGERFLPPTAPYGPILVIGLPSVVEATSTGFTLQVFFPPFPMHRGVPVNPSMIMERPIILQKLGWSVTWMGVES